MAVVGRALPRVALQLWIVLFIVFFGAEVVHLEPALRAITQILYGLPLAAWGLLRLRGPADRLDWAVLGLLVLYAVVCLFSRDRTESLGTLALAAAYAAWFGLMRREQDLRAPITVAIATGLTLTLAFNAYLAIKEKADWYAAVGAAPLEGVITFPWESVNTLPVLVLLAVPFIARMGPGPVRTAMAVVAGLSAVIVIPVSQGRAGYAGLAVAALTFAALYPVTGAFLRGQTRRRLATAGAVLAVAGGLAVAVLAPRIVNGLGTSGRLLIWEQGLNMIASSPIVGSGPGVYSWVRLEFPPAGADLLAVRLLHSVPLLTLVEGGIVLFTGVIATLTIWATVTARSRLETNADRVSIAALVGFAVSSLIDDFSFLPAVTAGVLTLAAHLGPIGATEVRRGWLLPAVLGLAAVLSLPSVVGVDAARGAAQGARTDMVRGAYTEAVAGFEAATRSHPENGGYWLGLGMARAWDGDREGAILAYDRAIAASPGDPRGYAALAPLDLDVDAAHFLAAAADRTLGDPQWALRLGAALGTDGHVDEATQAWARVVALQPEMLRHLPFPAAGVSRDAVLEEAAIIIRDQPGPAPDADLAKLWNLALAADEVPADAGLAWRAVDAARHGDLERGSDLADQAVANVAYDPRAYQATAAVAAFACDAGAEERALDLEQATGKGWTPYASEPLVRREFVYREASLGPTQPPNVTGALRIERWPWSLIDRPAGCGS